MGHNQRSQIPHNWTVSWQTDRERSAPTAGALIAWKAAAIPTVDTVRQSQAARFPNDHLPANNPVVEDQRAKEVVGPTPTLPHAGLDVAGDMGTPIRSAAPGRVVSAGWDGSYGLAVVIEHHNGLQTRYAHASLLRVKAGDWAQAGTVIAEVGTTGFSTGPHLRFEVLDGAAYGRIHFAICPNGKQEAVGS